VFGQNSRIYSREGRPHLLDPCTHCLSHLLLVVRHELALMHAWIHGGGARICSAVLAVAHLLRPELKFGACSRLTILANSLRDYGIGPGLLEVCQCYKVCYCFFYTTAQVEVLVLRVVASESLALNSLTLKPTASREEHRLGQG
jgi:hypothetical protein